MSDQNSAPHSFRSRKLSGGLFTTIVVLGIIAVTGFSSIYSVNANERGVVTRFGRYHSTQGDGLHGKLPFGIDRVTKVTQTLQSKQFGFRTLQAGVSTTYDQGDYTHESEMLTGDLNIVNATWIIEYRITDPQAWLFNVDDTRVSRSEDNRDKTLRDITQSVVNQLVGDRAILDLMSSERVAVESLGKEMIQETLNFYGLGVNITEVKMQQVVAPEGAVQDAFEDVNKATQDRERLINEGEQAYYTEIPRIEGEAKQMIAEAAGYKESRINTAMGDVALFQAIYDEYRVSPGVTRQRLYYETLAEVLSTGENTNLIGRNLENFLPLKNLDAQGGGE